jgi:polyribonucleotide nucleotidyltransferase
VKLIGIDQKTGKFKLSRKVLMPKPEFKPREESKEQARPANNNG